MFRIVAAYVPRTDANLTVRANGSMFGDARIRFVLQEDVGRRLEGNYRYCPEFCQHRRQRLLPLQWHLRLRGLVQQYFRTVQEQLAPGHGEYQTLTAEIDSSRQDCTERHPQSGDARGGSRVDEKDGFPPYALLGRTCRRATRTNRTRSTSWRTAKTTCFSKRRRSRTVGRTAKWKTSF